MINGLAHLVVDMGNSETRVITMFGKNAKGNARKTLSVIPNRFALHDRNIVIADPISEDNSSIFESSGEAAGQKVMGTYAHGLLVDREYSSSMMRPTAIGSKYSEVTTVLTLQAALLEGYRAVAEFSNADIQDVDVDWNVTVLLPPADMGLPTDEDSGLNQMVRLIRSIDKISFSMPKLEKEIRIQDVGVLPEGMCAYMGVLFKSPDVIREGYEHLLTDSVFIADIGGGTTDFLLIEQGKPVESSKVTVSIGGSNVDMNVRAAIKAKYRVNLTVPQGRNATLNGTFRNGGLTEDCRDIIADAKRTVAQNMTNSLIEAFELSGTDIRSVNQLLVVGGGAEPGKAEGIEPIGNYLVETMKHYAPNISLVQLPEERRVTEDGERILAPISPRILNIRGAATMAG